MRSDDAVTTGAVLNIHKEHSFILKATWFSLKIKLFDIFSGFGPNVLHSLQNLIKHDATCCFVFVRVSKTKLF